MKLFAVLFGAAVAVSMVAAQPDVGNSFGDDDIKLFRCWGEQNGDYSVYIIGECGNSVVSGEFMNDGDATCLVKGIKFEDKLPSSDLLIGSGCCEGPDSEYADEQPTCVGWYSECTGLADAIRDQECTKCIAAYEEPEQPVGDCCQGCCAKKSALKESLPGAVYEAIESEWLTQSIDSVEEYNIGDSVGACGCPTEREMKFKGSTTSFTCQPLCCDCCEDMDLSMLTAEAVVTNQASYAVQTAGGCTPYGHTVSDHVTYYQSTVQNWKGSNTEICYIGNDTDVETVVVIAGGLQAVASYDNEIFTYYYGSTTVFGDVSINSKCIRKIDGGNSGRDNSWYPTNNTCDQPTRDEPTPAPVEDSQ